MTAEFGQLQFDRTLKASPARVFEALTNPRDRMAWGPPDADSVVLIEGNDQPVTGMRDTARVGPRDNPYVDVATDWIVLDAPSCLIYAETLMAEGAVLTTSLATFELSENGDGTDMRATIHLVNFAGAEMMGEVEAGWSHAVDSLAQHV